MQRLALVLSVLAAGLAGYAAYVVSALPAEVHDLRARVEAAEAVEARLGALERRAEQAPAKAPAAVPVEPVAHLAAGQGSPGTPPTTTVAPVAIEELQKRVESLEATARGALGLGDDAPLGKDAVRGARPGALALGDLGGRLPKVYGSVDDAQKDLELTDGQRADFERAAAEARRELEELRKTPDADGVTWEQVQKDAFKSENGVFRIDMSKMEAFREKTIPGRSESYGAADRRIREQAKRRMRDALTPEQREKYDKAMVDPLIGGLGGGGFSFATATVDVVSDD